MHEDKKIRKFEIQGLEEKRRKLFKLNIDINSFEYYMKETFREQNLIDGISRKLDRCIIRCLLKHYL